jgi:hypothetical protein
MRELTQHDDIDQIAIKFNLTSHWLVQQVLLNVVRVESGRKKKNTTTKSTELAPLKLSYDLDLCRDFRWITLCAERRLRSDEFTKRTTTTTYCKFMIISLF